MRLLDADTDDLGTEIGGGSETTPAAVTSPAGDDTGSGSQGGAPAAAAASDWSVRGELASLGLEGDFADDRAAVNALKERLTAQAERFQQAEQLARYGQYYLSNQQAFQAALQRQHQPAAPAATPAKEPWWKVPQWNPEDERHIAFDKDGRPYAKMGADPSLGLRYEEYQRWQREKFQAILRDPIGTLKPGIEEMVQPLVEKLVAERIKSYDDRQFSNQFVQQQAAPWAYQRDQAGNVVLDQFTGKPALSPAGQRFVHYVGVAERELGITDPRKQQEYAMIRAEHDALTAYHAQHSQQPAGQGGGQQVPPPSGNDEKKRRAVLPNGSRRIPAGGGATVPPAGNGGRNNGNRDIRASGTLGAMLAARLREANSSIG